jgi:WD40 repeat protein
MGLLVVVAVGAIGLVLMLHREQRGPPGSSSGNSPTTSPAAPTPAPLADTPSLSSPPPAVPEQTPPTSPPGTTSGDASVPVVSSPAPAAPAAVAPPAAHVVFVADGKLLLIAADGKLEFCDVTSGARRAVGVTVGRVEAVGVSPDGRMLVTADASGKITLTETAGYSVANVVASGVAGARGVAIAADGRTIAVASAGGVTIWDLVDRRAKTKLLANQPCDAVAFSADGKMLFVGTSAGVSAWETTFWQKQAALAGGGTFLKVWPARNAIVASDASGNVRVYDSTTRQLQSTIATGPLTDLAPSPDGRTIVTCGSGGLMAWDSFTRAPRKLP